jgi:hypothetical protein
VFVELVGASAKSLRVTDGDVTINVPKSLIGDESDEVEVEGSGELELPAWFAEREGLE